MKQCNKCKEIKLLDEFYKDKKTKDGYRGKCKICMGIESKIFREANKEESKLKRKIQWKKYYAKNKDKILSIGKRYSENNKEKIKEQRKLHYKKNIAKIRIYKKKYNQENKKKISIYNKKKFKIFYKKNKYKLLEYQKWYNKNNRDKINTRNKNRRKNDIQFKIASNLRSRIRQALKTNQKTGSTIELLGCSIDFFIKYLESKFTKEMTKEKLLIGKIHIDHIIPCSNFDLSDPKQQKQCFHFTNLQPLWESDNCSKGNKLINKQLKLTI